MNRGMKIAIAIVMDMLFLVAIVYAVAVIIRGTGTPFMRNLAKAVIVILIPCMFYMSFMTFSGERYDKLPEDLLEDGDEEGCNHEDGNFK